MSTLSLEKLSFTFVTRDEFMPVFNEHREKIFAENNDINYSVHWSEEETAKFKDLQSKCKTEVRSFLLCKDEDKIIGWSFGYQKDAEEFYMVNSAVFPEYRNRGVYTKLLEMIIEKAAEEGFQIVSSFHHASNNAIIIPKLKAGFKIVGMKINPRFGTLVELHYFTNEKVGQILDYRTGSTKKLPPTSRGL
jgi:ribosomal protein S18 acetylase RimI-like enzyme